MGTDPLALKAEPLHPPPVPVHPQHGGWKCAIKHHLYYCSLVSSAPFIFSLQPHQEGRDHGGETGGLDPVPGAPGSVPGLLPGVLFFGTQFPCLQTPGAE